MYYFSRKNQTSTIYFLTASRIKYNGNCNYLTHLEKTTRKYIWNVSWCFWCFSIDGTEVNLLAECMVDHLFSPPFLLACYKTHPRTNDDTMHVIIYLWLKIVLHWYIKCGCWWLQIRSYCIVFYVFNEHIDIRTSKHWFLKNRLFYKR